MNAFKKYLERGRSMAHKRLLSCTASEVKTLTAAELKQAIKASEGRIILADTVVTKAPLIEGVSNAEMMRAFSADMLLLNEYDLSTKFIHSLPAMDAPIAYLKELTGRPMGLNLEPVDPSAEALEDWIDLPEGRRATVENFQAANREGFDFLVLTGNPSTGVSHQAIEATVRLAKQHFKGLVFAGKMHSAGTGEKVVSEAHLLAYMAAGADGVLIPSVGTVPGVREDQVARIADQVKDLGGLVISTIGTSQESADSGTIREFALANKRVGTDIHHIGDGSYGRMPDPENILTLSLAIRGKRHTYFRMGQSVLR